MFQLCKKTCRAVLAVAALAGWGAAAPAQAEEMRISELGYRDGLTLEGQGARRTLFFPVPPGADAGRLRVEARFSEALDERSSLTLYAEGAPLRTIAPDETTRRRIFVDLPERLLDDAYVAVEVAGDLALERGACSDNSGPSVWARLDPASGVVFSGADRAETLGDMWRLLSGEVRVGLLPAPSSAELSAALTVMAELHRRGLIPVPEVMDAEPPRDMPEIVVGDPPWPDAQAAYGTSEAVLGILRLSGAETAGRAIWAQTPDAARLLASREEFLRGQTHVVSASRHLLPARRGSNDANGDGRGRRVTFAELGNPTEATTFSSRGAFRVDLPMTRVPSGYVPSAAVLSLRGPELGENDALLVNAYTNGDYADSLRLDEEVVVNQARIPFSPELLGGRNTVDLSLQRLAPGRPCALGVTTTVQLHGGSYFDLEPGEFVPARIRDWAARYDETVEVVLPEALGARMRALPMVARLLAEGTLAGTEIEVAEEPRGEGPFIHVADHPPEPYDSAPIAVDRGVVRIETSDGRVLRFDPGADATLVGLVERAGSWGVWIAPGARMTLPAGQGMGEGDAALIPPSGAPAPLDTRARAFDATYPQSDDPFALLKRHRTALFWSFWIVLTGVVAVVVIRMRRRQEES